MNTEEIVFLEKHAAAQSMKNAWTRMASTYRCIQVALTKDLLIVRPHWLIGWIIFLLRLDLHHTIPIEQIKSIKSKGSWYSYDKVEVVFRGNSDSESKILLYLKKHEEFLSKLKKHLIK